MPFRIEEDMRQFIKEAKEPFVEIHQKSKGKNRNKKMNEKMIIFLKPAQIRYGLSKFIIATRMNS